MPVPVKGIEHVDAFVAQAAPELLAQHVVGALQDEVHDLDRGVDDAEAFGVLLERGREELLVELHQHPLPRRAVVEAAGAHPDALVETLQVPHLVLEAELAEVLPQGVQGPGHRVGGREVVMLEQRLEDRAGQDVLRHDFDGVAAADRLVDRDLQLLVERAEPLAQSLVAGGGQQVPDPVEQPGEDVRDVPGPGLPVLPVSALVDDPGVDGAGRQVHRPRTARPRLDRGTARRPPELRLRHRR